MRIHQVERLSVIWLYWIANRPLFKRLNSMETANQLPQKLASLLDLYDSGKLPADLEIEMCQFLLDTDLCEVFTQYQQLCDRYVLEGMCYEVG